MNATAQNFEDICNNFRFNDSDSPFVISYTTNSVRIFITLSIALRNLAKSYNMHVDATHKINVYGFPVIVVGFTDNNRKFFVSGIILTSNESKEPFSWVLEQIRNYTTANSISVNIRNIIADNTRQTTSAVSIFDSNMLRTNCWAHILRLVKTSIEKIGNRDLRTFIYPDIRFVQALTFKQLFQQGLELFKNKYSQFLPTRQFIQDLLIPIRTGTRHTMYLPHQLTMP